MSNSFPCQVCVMGFLCGVCIVSLFLAALTSFGSFAFRGIGFSAGNSTSETIFFTGEGYNLKHEAVRMDLQENIKPSNEDRRASLLLYSAWTDHLLKESTNGKYNIMPKPPHLEDCKLSHNETFPPWNVNHKASYPPWITGSDEENYPLTRKVQRDLWIRQHPLNCSNSSIRFLVADWEKLPGFGIGAQLAGMCGLLAIAVQERRVLVTNYYNRADHDGCKGSSRSSWSCYFFPETSMECRKRAFELMGTKESWETGIITGKDNYTSKEIWAGRTPRIWGNPWSYLQPTTEINGILIRYHRKMDRRWWRAQALRYLMRFETEYTCSLLNAARHAAFGHEAANMVLAHPAQRWPENGTRNSNSEIEELVWSKHKPWIPRPLLSMHVRMGDKACEMKVVQFEEYMRLAERVRMRFPHLNTIWLSTEMQEVVDKSKAYPHWKFYYTHVTRQVGNMTMAVYEASLGRKMSTNYPLVNFLMATEADFFVGALGSTWCFLIDGMRNTGGKVMAGYLSVN